MRPTVVAPGIYQVQAIGAKVTVIPMQNEIILVDTGGRGSLRLVKSGMEALGFSLDQVGLIVITHYHPDHAGALGELVKATGAKVAAHRLEAGILNRQEPLPSPFLNPVLRVLTQPFLPLSYGSPVNVDCLLGDRDILPLAQEMPFISEMMVVHTPGHSPGSICLYVKPSKALIVGDALQYRFGRLTLPARYVTQNHYQARESLRKLLDLDFETICFSHFPPLKQRAKEAVGKLVARSNS